MRIFRDMEDEIYDTASVTQAIDGAVHVDGPDGVAILFTPEAAEETSHRLLDTALVAKGQQRLRKGTQQKPDD